MRELYINGFLIDLYPKDSETIVTSYQISNIAEFEDVQANFSNTFSVPKTENNISRIGNADLVGSNSFVPYRKNPARYINNGIDIVDNGFSIIEDAGDEFSITILSGNFDLFAQIGNRKISEIDASELDHEYTLDAVVALNAADGDAIWPLVQLGGYANDGIVDIRWQMPAVKHSFFIRKIFEGTTWGYAGDIFYEEKYRKLVIEMLANDVVDEDAVLLSKSASIGNNTFSLPTLSGDVFLSLLANNRFDILTGPNFDSTAGYFNRTNPNAFKYIAQTQVIIDIEFNLYFNYNGLTPFYIYKNNSFPSITSGSLIYSSVGNVPVGNNFFATTIQGIPLNPGDYLMIVSRGNNGVVGNFYADGTIVGEPESKSFIKFTAKKSAVLDGTVHYNPLLPEIKQSEFIKNFCNQFGILMQPNYKTNKIEFKQHKSIREGNAVVDWSDKVDTNVTPSIKFRRQEYGQNTFLRWGQEDDAQIGDGFFIIDDNVLDYTADLFVMDFNSSLQYLINDMNGFLTTGTQIKRFTRTEADTYSSQKVYAQGDIVLYSGIVYIFTDTNPFNQAGFIPTDTTKWSIYIIQFTQSEDSTNRLLYYRKQGSFNITDGIGNTAASIAWPVAYFADASQPYDLDFTNIITREYAPFVAMMQQYKEVSVNIRLNEIDIQNLDFFKMVAIEYLGNKFYLMLVDEYESDEPSTTCILIRI